MENHRILIVEDDEAIAGAVSRIIESWGLTPRCVRDFRDVLREFTDFDPHLVLMDITLPFFNGYHWCSEIRKISAVPVIERGGAVLNLNDETVTHDGQKVQLTRNEFRILQTLMESRGKVVSRETLMTRLWEYDLYIEENTLTVNMTRLRKKLSGIGLTDFITTRVGSGYVVL